MTRKQHIDSLVKQSRSGVIKSTEISALQYAIDHLSREWVSRKTHRKLVATLNKDRDEWQKKAIDRKSEIDHLKIQNEVLSSENQVKGTLIHGWKGNASDWERMYKDVNRQMKYCAYSLIATLLLILFLLSYLIKI